MPKDKGKCQAQSVTHNLLYPSPYSAGIIPDPQDYLLSQQNHEDMCKKEHGEGWGLSHSGGSDSV